MNFKKQTIAKKVTVREDWRKKQVPRRTKTIVARCNESVPPGAVK